MFLVPVTRSTSEFGRSLDRLFDDSFERLFTGGPASEASSRSPALDVTESERAYTVHLDMPGVTKEAVKIAIDGRRISVQAQGGNTQEKKEGERVIYRERSTVSFARSFTLPADIDQSESQARLEHGVLTLTLAKRRASGASHLTVN